MDSALATTDRGEPRWFLGTAIRFLVSAREGNDSLCVVEHHMPHGDAPPLHVHHHEDEIFVVLHGTLRMEVGGRTHFLHTGDSALAPKGVPHSYVVESDGARVITITRGHDLESMLRSVSRPANRPGLPPRMAPDADTVAKLAEVCRQNGIDLVGPPLSGQPGIV